MSNDAENIQLLRWNEGTEWEMERVQDNKIKHFIVIVFIYISHIKIMLQIRTKYE